MKSTELIPTSCLSDKPNDRWTGLDKMTDRRTTATSNRFTFVWLEEQVNKAVHCGRRDDGVSVTRSRVFCTMKDIAGNRTERQAVSNKTKQLVKQRTNK